MKFTGFGGVELSQSNFAVFVDLENVGAKESMMQYIIDKVKIRGDILLGKVYGYTDRYDHLKKCLLSNTFSVVPSLRHGKCQKNNLDIQLVIDALEVAYVNPLIDSFCIVSGDSDYTPLVGKLKSMGKYVLGISRSEAASDIFIAACNEFMFLESMAAVKTEKREKSRDRAADVDLDEMASQIEAILEDRNDEMYASEIKDTLMRLRPDFNERNFGTATFGKFMGKVAERSGRIQLRTEDSSLMVNLVQPEGEGAARHIDRSNFVDCFRQALEAFKREGFDRINPSILKATIQEEYPDYSERQVGFRRFSDVMKALEREKLLTIEMDDQHTMLLKIM